MEILINSIIAGVISAVFVEIRYRMRNKKFMKKLQEAQEWNEALLQHIKELEKLKKTTKDKLQ